MKAIFLVLFAFSLNSYALEDNSKVSASELNESLSFLFKMFHKSGTILDQVTSPSPVAVNGRSLSFTKKYDYTKLVITYDDVFRVHPGEKMCTLYLEIKDYPCQNGNLFKSIYTHNSQDINLLNLTHTCSGIPKGQHTFIIKAKANAYNYVSNFFAGGVCEFSWSGNSSFFMTVKEVF